MFKWPRQSPFPMQSFKPVPCVPVAHFYPRRAFNQPWDNGRDLKGENERFPPKTPPPSWSGTTNYGVPLNSQCHAAFQQPSNGRQGNKGGPFPKRGDQPLQTPATILPQPLNHHKKITSFPCSPAALNELETLLRWFKLWISWLERAVQSIII